MVTYSLMYCSTILPSYVYVFTYYAISFVLHFFDSFCYTCGCAHPHMKANEDISLRQLDYRFKYIMTLALLFAAFARQLFSIILLLVVSSNYKGVNM